MFNAKRGEKKTPQEYYTHSAARWWQLLFLCQRIINYILHITYYPKATNTIRFLCKKLFIYPAKHLWGHLKQALHRRCTCIFFQSKIFCKKVYEHIVIQKVLQQINGFGLFMCAIHTQIYTHKIFITRTLGHYSLHSLEVVLWF